MHPRLLTLAMVGALTVSLQAASPPPAPADPPQQTAATTAASGPRQVIEETIPAVVDILQDRAAAAERRNARLKTILQQRADLPVLSRAMLGGGWDAAGDEARQHFLDALADYLVSVYSPLMENYAGEQVQVAQDKALGRDHLVVIRVTQPQAAAPRALGHIACRMREAEGAWKVIDVTVEGISVARVFGAQFRPVMERSGLEALTQQLRQKVKTADAASH
jgi:phospholipid transport system substrate-binding protein